MTQIVAIPCKDRIVVSGDGKMYDTETKKYDFNTPKLFKMTDSICLMITGTQMKEPAVLISHLIAEAVDRDIKSFSETISFVAGYLKRKNPLKRELYIWQDEKSTKEELDRSQITFMVAGYDGNMPNVCIVSSALDVPRQVSRYTLGAWNEEGVEHLMKTFGNKTHKKIHHQDAELEAITIIMNAEKVEPELVGGNGQLWYIKRHGVPEEKPLTYITSIRRRVHI